MSLSSTRKTLLSQTVCQRVCVVHCLINRRSSPNPHYENPKQIDAESFSLSVQNEMASNNENVNSQRDNLFSKHCYIPICHISNARHSILQPIIPKPQVRSLQHFSNHGHRPILHRSCDNHHKSILEMSSFSPSRLILESSPKRVQPYLRLIRFDKPIGTWLLYWPCTWSIALAAQPGCLPDMKLLALFGAGAFFMRGAGCIINDMWDKDFDTKVERTKQRPLASGELTTFNALVLLASQLSCALTILLQLNWYSVFLGASSMGLVILYPLAKRYTYWPQIMLGFTFNYGALLGWSAVTGYTDWSVCLPLYFSCVLWTLVYDTIYAHQDKYDDMLIGVKSTALKLGDQTKPWLYGFTSVMCGGMLTAGLTADMTWPYYTAMAITCGRLAHQTYFVNLNNAESCANAFKGNFYLGVVMFMGIVMGNYIKVQKESDSSNRLDREDRPDRPDREDRSDRPDREDRPDRPDQEDRPDRPDREDRPDRD